MKLAEGDAGVFPEKGKKEDCLYIYISRKKREYLARETTHGVYSPETVREGLVVSAVFHKFRSKRTSLGRVSTVTFSLHLGVHH